MSIQFKNENFFVDETSLKAIERRSGDIPKSDELTGIELRLSRVLIRKNGSPKIFPFPGLAKIYLLVIVTSDINAESPINNLVLKDFAKVDDMEDLPIDRAIFYWKKEEETPKNPSQLHAFISIIKSKENLRDVAQVLTAVKNDEDFKSLSGGLQQFVKNASLAGQVTDTLFNMASVVGKHLGHVNDKPLLTWVQSYTDINGDLDFIGKQVKQQENDNAKVALTLIVRDKNREERVMAAQDAETKEQLTLDSHD